jgi:hypothetical protein
MDFLFILLSESANENSWLEPTVITAIIGAIIAFLTIRLSYISFRIQQIKSIRDETYKKLNSFYGPIRLQLSISLELYKLLKESVVKRTGAEAFRTLPFILSGNKFSRTEKTILRQIIDTGKKIERTIENNAGLIDDENLNIEMVALCTHIRIIRQAYKGNYEVNSGNDILFNNKTFPNELAKKIDTTFYELKAVLKKLNEMKL